MRKNLTLLIAFTFSTSIIQSSNAALINRFETQTKNFGAVYSLQQNNKNGLIAPGKTELRIDISNVFAEFNSKINYYQEEDNGRLISNGDPEYCTVKPAPDNGLPGLTLTSKTGPVFNVRAGIEISDQSNFNRDESKTYFALYMNIPLNLSGNDYLNLKYDDAVFVWDKSTDKQLSSKYITRQSNNSYSLAPMTFNIESVGKLYIKTVVDFSQNISQPMCPKTNVTGWGNAYELDLQTKIMELDVAKMSQQILASSPGSPSLSDKVTRIKVASTSGLPVTTREVDSSICIADRDLVHLLKKGTCSISLSQAGDDSFDRAQNVILSFSISSPPSTTTITCIKGKLTKSVTAVKPTCPTGYRKKS